VLIELLKKLIFIRGILKEFKRSFTCDQFFLIDLYKI